MKKSKKASTTLPSSLNLVPSLPSSLNLVPLIPELLCTVYAPSSAHLPQVREFYQDRFGLHWHRITTCPYEGKRRWVLQILNVSQLLHLAYP